MAENPTKKKADEERARRVEEEKDRARRAAIQETPIIGRNVTPDVDTADPVEAQKQDPRLGQQDVPDEERTDGVTAGIRHDQMQGVQSAAQFNDLDQEEILAEQLEAPANLAVADVRASERIVDAQDDGAFISPRTEEEQARGRESLARYDRPAPTSRSKKARESKDAR